MGLLNKNSRIVDTYLTSLGRKKLAEGNLGITFVALTDKSAMYISSMAGDRDEDFRELCLEPLGEYQDNIFFTSKSSEDYINNFENNNFSYQTGEYTIDQSGVVYSQETADVVTDSNFSSTSDEIISDSIERIKNKVFLKNKSNDTFDSFKIDKNKINFFVSNSTPLSQNALKEINVKSTEPFFFDKHISSTDNFKFLPPVLPTGENAGEKKTIGEYTDLNQDDITSFSDVQDILKGKQYREVSFDESSRESNIVMQMFSINNATNNTKIKKLDTIDFGEFYQDGSFKKVIFAGKVFINEGQTSNGDNYRYPSYTNIFTIVMEE